MKFFYLMILYVVFIVCGCADTKKNVKDFKDESIVLCPENESIYGNAVAGSYQTALMLAQKNVLGKVDSLINIKFLSDESLNNNFDNYISLVNNAQLQYLSRLENREFLKIDSLKDNNGKISLSVCMSKKNLSDPFKKKYNDLLKKQNILDSNYNMDSDFLKKKLIFKSIKDNHIYLVALSRILKVLNEFNEFSHDSIFVKVNRDYQWIQKNYSFRYVNSFTNLQSSNSELLKEIILARISSYYPICKKSQSESCGEGVDFSIDVVENDCTEGDKFKSCLVTLKLIGKNSNGDIIFEKVSKISETGSDLEILDKLTNVIKNGIWFDDWRKILNEWSMN